MAMFESQASRFVLGAMLPDLSSMAGARIERVNDRVIAAGVDHHHQIDHAFHACAPFVALCTSALTTLEAQGVSRAAARAVGHVGSELLIDGALSAQRDSLSAYSSALHDAIDHNAAQEIAFRAGDSAIDMHALLVRLADAPIPQGYREPEFVLTRLQRILAPRPRLALQAHELEPVRAWLEHAHARIDDDARAIVELLRAHA